MQEDFFIFTPQTKCNQTIIIIEFYKFYTNTCRPFGKTELVKLAKELGLDAIHDTVHEMARDEARHGKAFEGLLARYFK